MVRSPKEARQLSGAGCDNGTTHQSASMSTFLQTYGRSYEALLGPARLERGRIVLLARDDCVWARMQDVGELARELGLSVYDGSAQVYVTLDPTDMLALAAMVRLVLVGELDSATLSDQHWTLTVRASDGSLLVRVSSADVSTMRALRLLGFRESDVPAEARRLLEPLTFAAGKLLQRVLVSALDMQGHDVEAILTSEGKLRSATSLPASPREIRIGLMSGVGSTEARAPRPT